MLENSQTDIRVANQKVSQPLIQLVPTNDRRVWMSVRIVPPGFLNRVVSDYDDTHEDPCKFLDLEHMAIVI